MNMRWIVLLVALPFVVACGSEDGADSSSGSGSGSGDGGAGSASSRDAGDRAKWRVAYSGDLEGEVSGTIMSVMSIGRNTTVAGGAMNSDLTGAADHGFRATITQYGDSPQTAFSLNLADGTECFDVTPVDPEPSAVRILDADSDTFKAEIEGTMYCGADKSQRIDFKAVLDNDR